MRKLLHALWLWKERHLPLCVVALFVAGYGGFIVLVLGFCFDSVVTGKIGATAFITAAALALPIMD